VLDHAREDGPPAIQPGDHLFSPDLGDGVRNHFTHEMLPGWQRPAAELVFEMRQLTVAERCRAFRMATDGGNTDNVVMLDKMIEYTIRKIGDLTGDLLTDDFVHQWVQDLGLQGSSFLETLFTQLHSPPASLERAYVASMRTDIVARTQSFVIPAGLVPRKRWAARVGRACMWAPEVPGAKGKKGEKATTGTPAHWVVDGSPADQQVAEELGRDLRFTMSELRNEAFSQISNIVADVDDAAATRQMAVMFAITNIGGRALGRSNEDLVYKRKWSEDVGPKALSMIMGSHAKIQATDHGLLATFLGASEALE
jgi:hypothetical protein